MKPMPSLLKKLSVSLFLFLFLFLGVVGSLSSVKAEGEWYNQSYDEWHQKVYNETNPNEIFGERYTAAQVQWILYALFSNSQKGINDQAPQIVNCVMKKDAVCLGTAIKPLATSIQKNSLANGQNKSLLSQLVESRPISAISYFRDIGQKFQLVPEAKAQGFGFNSALNPILDIWKVTRNISYAVLVIVVLVMAFMIMFRVKISPQAVITVQSALPKVVIAIILVTFSYAIAGLIIDLMYVFIGIISLMVSQILASSPTGAVSVALNTLLGAAGTAINNATTSPAAIFGILTKGFLNMGIFGFLVLYWLGFLITGGLTALSQDSAFMQLGLSIFVVIAFIVLIIVLLFIGLKIIWMLFKTVAMILLMTIVAPLQIVLGVVIPQLSFDKWLVSFIANVAVFPVAGAMLILSLIFLQMALIKAIAGIMDPASIIGILGSIIPGVGTAIAGTFQAIIGLNGATGWPPLLSISDPNATVALVFLLTSFVIMTTIPKTVELIQSIIKGQAFNYGTAIGEATNPLGITSFLQQAGQKWATERIVTGGIPGITARVRSGTGRRTSAGTGPISGPGAPGTSVTI